MPRGFTEKEKKSIKKALAEKGKAAFETYGFGKTTIADLAKAANIAKGSFYQFYQSKEELFVDIMEEIEDRIQGEMLQEIAESPEPADLLLKRLMKRELLAVREEPILRMALSTEVLERVWRKLPEERIEANIGKDVRFLTHLMEKRPEALVLRSHDPAVMAGLFRSLFFLVLHEPEIGTDAFQAVSDFYVEALVDKLFKEGAGEEEHGESPMHRRRP